jgi:hypothetical protein
MPKEKHAAVHSRPKHYFSKFLDDPLVSSAFVVIALITLMFAIMEFAKAVAY